MSKTPKLRFKEFSGDWETGIISDYGYFYYGKSAPKWSITTDAKIPCIRYGELCTTHNEIVKEIKTYTNMSKENLKFSKGGEVLVPRVGEKPLEFSKCTYLPFKDIAIGEMIADGFDILDAVNFVVCNKFNDDDVKPVKQLMMTLN